jgi:membrane protein implicated in regulation of membrane protease activity
MHPQFALLESFVWWVRLTAAQQLFYGIGILAGLATLVMAGLALIGLDHHDVPDVSVDHGGGTSLFSTKPLTGFFLGFGWGGGIALDLGVSVPVATLIGLGAGGILMVLLAWVIRAIYSMRSDGTRQLSNAVGAVGTVYISLPPSRATGGQIQVTVSGRLETLGALSVASRAIPSGEKVKVISIVDPNTVLVEPLG